MNKRGQVAIFVIVAILIVVGGILVYYFLPEIKTNFGGEIVPNSFLKSCIEEEIMLGVETLSKQGGYINPEGYVLYQDNKVKYLCYSSQYLSMCNVQQPLIKAHFEKELSELTKSKTEECVSDLRKNFEGKGYVVSGGEEVGTGVLVVPEKIIISVNAPMSVTKEATQSFTEFNIEIPSEMYSLLMITTSIIDYESTYGNTETSLYTQYYPNLIIHKNKLGDGSTIYTVGDVTTGEEFTFASRSLAWPGGYGFEA